MAQPAQLIEGLRSEVNQLLNTLDAMKGTRRQYDALGGAAFVDPFFEANPTYDFTAVDMGNALNSIQAIEDLLASEGGGHQTNLNKVR